jgi:hypothetical protein
MRKSLGSKDVNMEAMAVKDITRRQLVKMQKTDKT